MRAPTLRSPRWRRLAHRGERAWYAATGGERELPTYFIVGGKRCGTTSLDEYVVDHPLVMRGIVEKGSRYYDVNHDRGPAWFARHLPPKRVVDRLEQRLGQRPIVGESSPYYCFHPDSPRWIAEDVPDARLLMCLRDPVQRAWSHHRYEVARGFETLDFHAALLAEEARLTQGTEAERSYAHRHFSYLARSRYTEQIERLRAHFPAENVLVLESEQLFAEPRAVMARVFDHLGLPEHVQSDYSAHKALPRAEVPQESREWLEERLAQDVAGLPALLGFEPSWR